MPIMPNHDVRVARLNHVASLAGGAFASEQDKLMHPPGRSIAWVAMAGAFLLAGAMAVATGSLFF